MAKPYFYSKNLSSFEGNIIYFNLIYLIYMKIEYNNLYTHLETLSGYAEKIRLIRFTGCGFFIALLRLKNGNKVFIYWLFFLFFFSIYS